MHCTVVIWVIGEEQWPRALLRAELIERGHDAVGFLSIRDAIDHYLTRKPDAIVVEPRHQPAELLERLRKIEVPIIEIARPVSIGDIADQVDALV